MHESEPVVALHRHADQIIHHLTHFPDGLFPDA